MTIARAFLCLSLNLALLLVACEDNADPVASAGGSGGGIEACDADPEVMPRPLCDDFCQVAAVECETFNTPFDVCGQICECVLEEATAFSEECGAAFEAEYECAATLNCQEFVNYFTANSSPCLDETDATNAACGLVLN